MHNKSDVDYNSWDNKIDMNLFLHGTNIFQINCSLSFPDANSLMLCPLLDHI